MSPRFSIRRLMVIVAAVALVLALAVAAVNLRSEAVLGLTAAILALATLGVLLGRGRLRTFCFGFAPCGWAYLVVAFWSPAARFSLPTTRPLVDLGESILGIVPAVKGPDDVVPMVQWLYVYLSVAHSLVSLGVGLVGGLLLVVLVAAARKGAAVARPSARVPKPGLRGVDA